MLSLQKNYFFSLFSPPNFLFEISVISVVELFLRGGRVTHQSECMLKGGEVHWYIKRIKTNKGGGGGKN